jgi:hypothetical protein
MRGNPVSGSYSAVDAAALANKKLEKLGLPLLPGSQPASPEPKAPAEPKKK